MLSWSIWKIFKPLPCFQTLSFFLLTIVKSNLQSFESAGLFGAHTLSALSTFRMPAIPLSTDKSATCGGLRNFSRWCICWLKNRHHLCCALNSLPPNQIVIPFMLDTLNWCWYTSFTRADVRLELIRSLTKGCCDVTKRLCDLSVHQYRRNEHPIFKNFSSQNRVVSY